MSFGGLYTTKDLEIKPYWNDKIKTYSDKMWMPVDADCKAPVKDDPLLKMFKNSWLDVSVTYPLTERPKAGIRFHRNNFEGERFSDEHLKTKTIKLKPNKRQSELLKEWFGTARFVYNYTINYVGKYKNHDTFYNIRKKVIDRLTKKKEFTKRTPYDIKASAVQDAYIAIQNAIKLYQETGTISKLKYRKKKDLSQSILICKKYFKGDSFYTSKENMGNLIKSCEPKWVVNHDSRVSYKRRDGFYLHIPELITESPPLQRIPFLAFDPGVRTFLTGYSTSFVIEYGKGSIGKINRLRYHLSKLESKIRKTHGKKKQNLKKAAARMRKRIKNVRKDAICKVSKHATTIAKYIFIPEFNSSTMIKRKNRKISKRTVKEMLDWSHYMLRQRLIHQAKKNNCIVVIVNEAYTTQTCTRCGNLHKKIGSSKVFVCPNCGLRIGRDHNAARGIYLKALI